ncbi:MAG: hypothetical protein A3C30_00230 [Candidatus Levybacteria bacterium RIFCSPHIGHO2_02_FULL_40_18]|nr:MAG: hypothetical protein A2869_03925 [Candidatus Levybacteria bacterium RIFCSPHIGHO2_01_FULL_40_58]OGH27130.1 MAG: hypothetical protein A3C30_00230 [Candidatus Levybacteria bacterium RIFCSPHIGHO2_02_FULL_40_18]OGH30989.1 MAG: hypothetical protein A3E43_04645 [Candidatus Levybacteria bacterium RIFCSPHIGHO2_12_FULL_40_31]OGH41000.1 MAG: hypothetical protein A2894_01860 [Candidatus Levybacteria bacterium RIFCSPLOWO2_01_FULL_40_64]OGH48923.1 MAG: hypothetical protein A3I54_02695 [Candidatus Lev
MDNEQKKKNEQKIRILIEELRTSSKERHFIRANLYNEEVNKTEAAFRNLLFTFAIFLFTFTSPLFIEIKTLSEAERILLFLSWIFLLVSLLSGIVQIAIDIKYFFNGAERESKGEKLWSKAFISFDEYNETVKEDSKLYADFSPHSGLYALILQLAFLMLAFVLILSVASLLLFGSR